MNIYLKLNLNLLCLLTLVLNFVLCIRIMYIWIALCILYRSKILNEYISEPELTLSCLFLNLCLVTLYHVYLEPHTHDVYV